MAYSTNVLSIIENKGFQFNYEKNGNFDKLKFAPLPKKQPKVKTILLPELSFNPQYNTIHKTIADANLALQVKEGYENIKYVPITSSGYRGFSNLNSRKNGIAEGFNTEKTTQAEKTIDIPPSQPNSPQVYTRNVIPEILTRKSFPADFNPPNLLTSSDEDQSPSKKSFSSDSIGNAIWDAYQKDAQHKALKREGKQPRKSSNSDVSSDSIGNALWDAMVKDRAKNQQAPAYIPTAPIYVPPNKRTFAKLENDRNKAEKQQAKESTPGSGKKYSGARRKGTGKMPSASSSKIMDSDTEMGS